MKTKSIIVLTVLSFVTSICILMSGCVNGTPTPLTLSVIRVAANSGVSVALVDRPDWRPQFVEARDELKTLLNAGSISGEQLKSILNRLPVKELKSTEARIVISNTTILFDDYIRQATEINRVAAVGDVALAIYDGLNVALESTPEQLKAVKAKQRK